MARRILNRKDLRADFEAAERRKQGDEVEGEEDELEDEDEEEEAEGEGEEEEAAADEEEEAPAAKKPKKAKPVKEPKPKRTRTPKQVRQKVIWAVFNNSNQQVATFEYPKRKEADDHAAKLAADKKSTFFVQPLKVAMEEK